MGGFFQGLCHGWIIVTTAGTALTGTSGPFGGFGQFLYQGRDRCCRGPFIPDRIRWIVGPPIGLQLSGRGSSSLALASSYFSLGWLGSWVPVVSHKFRFVPNEIGSRNVSHTFPGTFCSFMDCPADGTWGILVQVVLPPVD